MTESDFGIASLLAFVHMYKFGCSKQMKSLPWKHIDRSHTLTLVPSLCHSVSFSPAISLVKSRVQLSFWYIFRSIDTLQIR